MTSFTHLINCSLAYSLTLTNNTHITQVLGTRGDERPTFEEIVVENGRFISKTDEHVCGEIWKDRDVWREVMKLHTERG